jgi:2-keto-4-pentenoate hydratase
MNDHTTVIEKAATILLKANESKEPCLPIRNLIGETDIVTAYEIQNYNVEKELAKGRSISGLKIGLTSFAVQKQLGVDQPDYGVIWADTEVKNGGIVSWEDLLQPKAEAEIAFLLGQDIPRKLENTHELLPYLEGMCAAIEIVGSRVENWNIRITDTVADNASASHYVLENEWSSLQGFDFEGCKMQLFKNNESVSTGQGSACMGNPLNAVLWLVNTMVELNRPLKKGYVLLSGALGPMVPMLPNDVFRAEIEGLGKVEFAVK